MGKMTLDNYPKLQITLNPSGVSKMTPNTDPTRAKSPKIGARGWPYLHIELGWPCESPSCEVVQLNVLGVQISSQCRELFDEYDANKNGVLDVRELNALLNTVVRGAVQMSDAGPCMSYLCRSERCQKCG